MKSPRSIDKSHIVKAMHQLDKEGLPKKHRSKGPDLHYNGRNYPTKHLVRLAYKFATGTALPHGKLRPGRPTYDLLKALGLDDLRSKKIEAQDEGAETLYPEGRRKYLRHRKLERNQKLSKMVKDKRLAETGDLCCDVCGFSFFQCYGQIGRGFIEAHHTIPISEFKDPRITEPEEIALVCSNCHQMLHRPHRGTSLLSIEKLRRKLTKQLK